MVAGARYACAAGLRSRGKGMIPQLFHPSFQISCKSLARSSSAKRSRWRWNLHAQNANGIAAPKMIATPQDINSGESPVGIALANHGTNGIANSSSANFVAGTTCTLLRCCTSTADPTTKSIPPAMTIQINQIRLSLSLGSRFIATSSRVHKPNLLIIFSPLCLMTTSKQC